MTGASWCRTRVPVKIGLGFSTCSHPLGTSRRLISILKSYCSCQSYAYAPLSVSLYSTQIVGLQAPLPRILITQNPSLTILPPHFPLRRPHEDHTPANMFRTLARRAAQTAADSTQSSKPTSTYVQQMGKLYPPKKVWPPNFKRLSLQEQLRFEKKYKRRLALATARPRWVKFTKLAQLFSISCKLAMRSCC